MIDILVSKIFVWLNNKMVKRQTSKIPDLFLKWLLRTHIFPITDKFETLNPSEKFRLLSTIGQKKEFLDLEKKGSVSEISVPVRNFHKFDSAKKVEKGYCSARNLSKANKSIATFGVRYSMNVLRPLN